MRWVRSIRVFALRVLYAALVITPVLSAGADKSTLIELPVFSTEAQDGYRQMFSLAGSRSLYLLGDASHGTEEFYDFRRKITQHLISEYGVRTVVLEEEWDSVEQINHYISGSLEDSESTKSLLDQAFPRWPTWVWNNYQMVEFVDWLLQWNRSHSEADQVKVLGMDMKEAILPAINRLSENWSTSSTVSDELARLSNLWQVVLLQTSNEIADAHAQIQYSLTKLRNELIDPEPLVDMLDFTNRYYQSYREDYFRAWNIRSEYMARFVISAIKAQKNQQAVVVWAHNNHVGDKSADDVQGTGLINMGQLIREQLGQDKVFVLGSASYQGNVLAARGWQKEGEIQKVAPARQDSIEMLLSQWQWDNPLLYFDNPQGQQKWSFDILHRGIGAVFDSAANDKDTWSITNIAKRYDALVFWKATGALQLQ